MVAPDPAEIVPLFSVRLASDPVAKIPVFPPELVTFEPITTFPVAVSVTSPVAETTAEPFCVKFPPDVLTEIAPTVVETPRV